MRTNVSAVTSSGRVADDSGVVLGGRGAARWAIRPDSPLSRRDCGEGYSEADPRPKGRAMNDVTSTGGEGAGLLKRNLLLVAGYVVVMLLVAGAYA